MPAQDKPYRVYRGGRVKGRVPLAAPRRRRRDTNGRRAATRRRRAASGPGDASAGSSLGLVLAPRASLVAWGVTSYLAVVGRRLGSERSRSARRATPAGRSGRVARLDTDHDPRPRHRRRHARRPRGRESLRLDHAHPHRSRRSDGSRSSRSRATSRSRSPRSGSRRSTPPTRSAARRSRCARSRQLTGLDVNHVAFVDFDRFEELIDAVGGIEVDVPRPIRSNRFDCPYATARGARSGRAGDSSSGKQHMDGRRALVYSRIRAQPARPGRDGLRTGHADSSRWSQATLDKVTSVGTRAAAAVRRRRPRRRRSRPTSSAWQLMQLGWVYFRADTEPRAALPARRRSGDGRRRVGHPRLRGQRRDRRDVHRPLGTARRRRVASRTRRAASSASARRVSCVSSESSASDASSCRPSSAGVSFFPRCRPPTTTAVAVLARRLARAAAVVGRVEPEPLKCTATGKRSFSTGLAPHASHALDGRVAHPLEHLERMPVRAAVLVDRHRAANLPARMTEPRWHKGSRRRRTPPRLARRGRPSARSLPATALWLGGRPAIALAAGGVPPPPADGLAAARGRDARALRRPRLARRASSSTSRASAAARRSTSSLAWAVAHLGLGLGGLRLVSAAFAVASLPLVALLGRRLAGRRVGARRDARSSRPAGCSSSTASTGGCTASSSSCSLSCTLALLRALDARSAGAGPSGSRDPRRGGGAPLRRARARGAGASYVLVARRDRLARAPRSPVRRVARARDPVLAHRPRARRPVRRRRRRRRREARRPGGVVRYLWRTAGDAPPAGGRSRWRRARRALRSGSSSARREARVSSLCVRRGRRSAAFLARAARRLGLARVAPSDLRRSRSSRSPSRRRLVGPRDACPRSPSSLVAALSSAEVALGVAAHAAALRVGARRAPGGARGGRGVARRDEPAGRRALRLRAALPRRVGAQADSFPHDGRAPRRRAARAPDCSSAPAPLGRGVWVLDASEREQPPPRLEIEHRAARRRAAPSRRAPSAPSSSSARASRR